MITFIILLSIQKKLLFFEIFHQNKNAPGLYHKIISYETT